MENKLLNILNDINSCEQRTLADNISERLNKLLQKYIKQLDLSYTNVLYTTNLLEVLKELSK